MVDYRSRILPETMRSINSASFTGSYQTLGTVLAHPCRLFKIANGSGVIVTVTIDGTNDHFVLAPGEINIVDLTSNAVSGASLEIAKGTQFSVKGTASAGLVTLTTWYVV